MSQTQEFSQFIIEHQLKHRVRIIAPSLFCDKERAHILQILLLKREAIETVNIVSEINSVTIHFSPEQLPLQNLLNLLEIVLANFSQKPRESIENIGGTASQKKGKKHEIMFGIRGMSCASCALFLEMVLSRYDDNATVSINYVSEVGIVKGYLSKAEIFKIIEENGYRAYSIDALEERKLALELVR
jgi:Cu+-exporting ATPase